MGCLKQLQITLASSDIETLNSIPVELIPAPGVGKAILVIAGYCKANAVNGLTTPYADDRQIHIKTDTADTPQQVVLSILQSTINTTHQFLNNVISPGTDDKQIIENKAVNVTSNGDTTTGTFTVDVYVLYQIVDL